MCNLYSSKLPQEAMRQLFARLDDRAVNLQPVEVYPDQLAPIIRHGTDDELELVRVRWGMPTPPSFPTNGLRPRYCPGLRLFCCQGVNGGCFGPPALDARRPSD